MIDIEEGRKLLYVGLGGLGLAVEDGCYRDFGTTEFCCDSFKGEVLFLLAFEEGWRGSWETGDEGGLSFC